MLTLPRTLTLTPSQFAEVCTANPEAVLEMDADGTLIEMTPTGGSTSARNSALLLQLQARAIAIPWRKAPRALSADAGAPVPRSGCP
jgi:Uma2 family endonuclease